MTIVPPILDRATNIDEVTKIPFVSSAQYKTAQEEPAPKKQPALKKINNYISNGINRLIGYYYLYVPISVLLPITLTKLLAIRYPATDATDTTIESI